MIEQWNEEYQMEAQAQGWDIYMIDGNPEKLEIQKNDEIGCFKTDEDALNFVRAWAHVGNPNFFGFQVDVCKLALKLIGE